jgi:predicted RNA polymerase sigma factor
MENCRMKQRITRAKEQATVNNVSMDDDVPDTPELRARR